MVDCQTLPGRAESGRREPARLVLGVAFPEAWDGGTSPKATVHCLLGQVPGRGSLRPLFPQLCYCSSCSISVQFNSVPGGLRGWGRRVQLPEEACGWNKAGGGVGGGVQRYKQDSLPGRLTSRAGEGLSGGL